MTERQFFENLRNKGYEVKIGKDISVRPPKKERFVRLMRNFGEEYSIEEIRRRILMQSRPERPLPEMCIRDSYDTKSLGMLSNYIDYEGFGRCLLYTSRRRKPPRQLQKNHRPPHLTCLLYTSRDILSGIFDRYDRNTTACLST